MKDIDREQYISVLMLLCTRGLSIKMINSDRMKYLLTYLHNDAGVGNTP